jgi:hypothetical protein
VGEIAAFASTPRTATVRARTEARLLRIEQAVVRQHLASSPETAMAIIADLGRRLQNLNSTLATLTRAADALAAGVFEPSMLDAMRSAGEPVLPFRRRVRAHGGGAPEQARPRIEMRTAAEIQSAMLPTAQPAARFRASRSRPRWRPPSHVGGDFYDYFPLDDRRVAIAVGDVSGKGVPAALFMAIAKTVLRTVARSGGGAADILAAERMLALRGQRRGDVRHRGLRHRRRPDRRGRHRERRARGDLPREPRRSCGEARAHGSRARALRWRRLPARQARLAPGDWIVVATDGVTEAFSATGEVFGNDRLEARIAELAAGDPGGMIAGVSAPSPTSRRRRSPTTSPASRSSSMTWPRLSRRYPRRRQPPRFRPPETVRSVRPRVARIRGRA